MDNKNNKIKIADISLISLFTAIICACGWVTVPAAIPFTLQTLGIFTALGVLGGKRGTLSVIVYVMLGLFGVPVFSGFKGGAGVLFGATGGYIIGFIFSALVYWLITFKAPESRILMLIGFVCGLLVCYAFGTVWFVEIYSAGKEPMSYFAALSLCVFPFIIPDMIKTAIAFALTGALIPIAKRIQNHR